MSMDDNEFKCYRGSQSNNRNVVMYNDDDGDDENFEIPNISHSVYIDTNELSRYLEDHKIIYHIKFQSSEHQCKI